jgi:hypothetical protein
VTPEFTRQRDKALGEHPDLEAARVRLLFGLKRVLHGATLRFDRDLIIDTESATEHDRCFSA